jgi:outer membrane lipoprotein SlyB
MLLKKRPFIAFGLLASTCLLGTGCETTSNTVGGAALGTGLGAVTGAIIGSATGRHNAAAGALIGAAAGGVGGALIGHAEDEKEKKQAAAAQAQYQQAQAAAEQQALTNLDVINMAKSGISDQVIVSGIRSRGGRFDTTPDAIVQLKANGVSDYVVQVMQQTPPPQVVPGGPVYGPDGVLVAPPPAVGVYVAPRPYYYGGYYRHW